MGNSLPTEKIQRIFLRRNNVRPYLKRNFIGVTKIVSLVIVLKLHIIIITILSRKICELKKKRQIVTEFPA